jgi:SAM-dependent methyltransferase
MCCAPAPQEPGGPIRAGWYKRLIARMLSRAGRAHERLVDGRKTDLLGALHGTVLEIGPGGGPNFAYYPSTIHWIGVEPNPYLHPVLDQSAARHGIAAELRPGQAESLPVADASVDAVVSTLVLCSVHDPERVLREIRRVLRPGGRFVFIEHVAAPAGSGLRRFQNLITPAWHVVGDGCRPNRETWLTIAQAGFADHHIEHFDTPLPVIRPHIAGYAVQG